MPDDALLALAQRTRDLQAALQDLPVLLAYAGNPNGSLTAQESTLCWDSVNRALYVNTSTGSGADWTLIASSTGGGGAPDTASYLTLALHAGLSGERRFVPAARLAATDGGANADYTLDLATTGVAAGTYGSATQVPQITTDAYGRLTAASAVTISGVSPSAHNLLDATYHGDAATGNIARGDLLYGNATPKVARLPLGGIAGSILTRNANDVAWSAYALVGTAGQTYTLSATGGTVPIGTGTAGRIAEWATTSTLQAATLAKTGAGLLTLNSANNYTLTIPATGTTALGAGTLGVATSNDVTGSTHTHAVTSSSNPGAAASLLASDSNGYLQLVRLGLGTAPGAKLDIVPASTSEIPLRTKSLQSTAPLGSELVTNGTFDSDLSGWTIGGTGSGWNWDSGKAKHTTGNTDTLYQNISVTNGTTYQVEITISGSTAGSVTLNIGGVYVYDYGTTTALNINTTYKKSLVAAGTGSQALTITPTSDFNGSIDNVTVKAITGFSQPNAVFLDSAGNVAIEMRALLLSYNTTYGAGSLRSNTTGEYNNAIGTRALCSNTTGSSNNAVGIVALFSNTIGSYNNAMGTQSLYYNTTGTFNNAMGTQALYKNTTGIGNSAVGASALLNHTTGLYNSAIGYIALYDLISGSRNTAVGSGTGRGITTGSYNTILGAFVTGLASNLSYNIILASGDGKIRQQIGASGTATFTSTATSSNAVTDALILSHEYSGAAAAGLGVGLLFALKSSTTAAQSAGRLRALWHDATHATRQGDVVLSAFDYNGEREGLRVRANGSAPAIAFYGGTPRTRAAALTAQLPTITYTGPKTPDYAIQDFVDVAGDGSKGYAFASKDEANTLLAVIANLQARVQELENALNATTGVNLIA